MRTGALTPSHHGSNRFAFDCGEMKSVVSYFVCLSTIQAALNRNPNVFKTCQQAIVNKTCPALRMIAKERIEGKKLFWETREEEPELPAFLKRTKEDDEAAQEKLRQEGLVKTDWKTPGGGVIFSRDVDEAPNGDVRSRYTEPLKKLKPAEPPAVEAADQLAKANDLAGAITTAVKQESAR